MLFIRKYTKTYAKKNKTQYIVSLNFIRIETRVASKLSMKLAGIRYLVQTNKTHFLRITVNTYKIRKYRKYLITTKSFKLCKYTFECIFDYFLFFTTKSD